MEVPEAQSNILESAKHGNSRAIAGLINRQLQSKGITAKASRKDDILQILLEAVEIPDQKTCCSFIEKGIIKINPQGIHTVKIYGKSQNAKVPEWNHSFQLYQNEDVFNFQDVLDPVKNAPESPKKNSKIDLSLVKNPKVIVSGLAISLLLLFLGSVFIRSIIPLGSDAQFKNELNKLLSETYYDDELNQAIKSLFMESVGYEKAIEIAKGYCSQRTRGMSKDQIRNNKALGYEPIEMVTIEISIQMAATKSYCPQFQDF